MALTVLLAALLAPAQAHAQTTVTVEPLDSYGTPCPSNGETLSRPVNHGNSYYCDLLVTGTADISLELQFGGAWDGTSCSEGDNWRACGGYAELVSVQNVWCDLPRANSEYSTPDCDAITGNDVWEVWVQPHRFVKTVDGTSSHATGFRLKSGSTVVYQTAVPDLSVAPPAPTTTTTTTTTPPLGNNCSSLGDTGAYECGPYGTDDACLSAAGNGACMKYSGGWYYQRN